MKKSLLSAITLIGIITLLPCCREKQWWEDCYSSETEARLDLLETNFAYMHDEKIEELKSRLSTLQEKIDDLEDTQIEEIKSKLSDLQDMVNDLEDKIDDLEHQTKR